MSDTGRLTMLLEQYRDRLHTRGEDGHDDDILYLLQVLESPLMKEFLTEEVPGGGAALLQEVASVLENHEDDVRLSPQSKRKRQLARQASLRALKIALTPRASPLGSPKISKASEHKTPHNNFPLTQNLVANKFKKVKGPPHQSTSSSTVPPIRGRVTDGDKPPIITPEHQPMVTSHPPPDQVVPQESTSTQYGHIYINPYTGKHELPVPMATSTSPTDDTEDYSHQHVLSNSTDTLIERAVTPYDDRRKKYSTGSEGYSEFAQKGLNSEDICTPDMRDSQEEFLQLLEFSKPSIAPSLLLSTGAPVRKDQPSSHPKPPPTLPSYNEALSSQQRVKSYEDLLNSNPKQPIHLGPSVQPTKQYQPLAPLPPQYYKGVTASSRQLPQQMLHQDGITTGVVNQGGVSGGQFVTLSLFKGAQGLGFSINKKKNSKKGELSVYVQDVQGGSIAEAEGICKGDYLVSINRQNVSGIGVPTIVSLLQQAKGQVEIVLYRKEGGMAHDGSPSPTMIPLTMPHPPQNNPSKMNKAPHSFPMLPNINKRASPPPSPVSVPPHPQFTSSSPYTKPTPPDSPRTTTSSSLISSNTNKITSSPVSLTSMTPPPPPPPLPPATHSPHVIPSSTPSSISVSHDSNPTLVGSHVVSNSSPYSATPPPPIQSMPKSSNIIELVSVKLSNRQSPSSGFGFSLVTDRNMNTYIKSIVPNGLAHKDGRLCPGDKLVVVNGQSVEGFSHESVLSILKDINHQGHDLLMVIARVKSETDSDSEEDLVSDTDSSSDYEDHEIELVKPVGQGLGIGINALVNDDKGVDRGIYIKSVNSTGPAGLNGNVFIKDRIIMVNNHSLKSLSNMEAANHLRNSGNVVKLVLRRRKPRASRPSYRLPPVDMVDESSDSSPTHNTVSPTPHSPTSHDNIYGQEEIDHKTTEKMNMLSFNDDEDDEVIIMRWKGKIPRCKTIKVAHISRSHSGASLGFTMESVFVRNDDAATQSHEEASIGGDIRHVIRSILPGGLIDQNNVLMVDDELLEVNGQPLIGMSHDLATQLVQSTSDSVTMVICRPRSTTEEEVEEIDDEVQPALKDFGDDEVPNMLNPLMTTSESEDDHHSNSDTLTSSSSPALLSVYLSSTIPHFSRRFERQSWRERQAELTKKLKERFETKRYQYYCNLQERIEELEKVDHELEARAQRMKENEENKDEEENGEEDKGMPLHSAAFDYSYPSGMGYYSTPIDEPVAGADTHVDTIIEESRPSNKRDSVASEDSSAGVLSPVPGSGLWDNETIEVELHRDKEGLGFSILDFADPVSQGDRVILVYSLVSGGTAEKDGRIQKGDKLLSVNGESVVNHSLEFTVEKLTSTAEDGLVHICVNHPIPDTPEVNSTPSSFSRDSIAEEEEEEEENIEEEEDNSLDEGEDDIVSVSDEGDKTIRRKQQTKKSAGSDDKAVNQDPLVVASDWQGGKHSSFNEEEEEPPPPYTEVDPLDKVKQHNTNRRLSDQVNGNRRSLTPGVLPAAEGDGITTGPPSQSFPVLNRTRSDEPAARHGGHFTDLHGSGGIRMMESTSEETIVPSYSNQDLQNITSGSQPSPKQHSSPQMRGKGGFVTTNTTSSLTSQESNQGLSQVPMASPRSQEDSAHERVSPDTSDTGDHSAEAEAEPRTIEISKRNKPLGMSLMEDKGQVYVKKIESSSALGRDGRIRAGDRILSINEKSLEGMPFSKVKSILKRASSNRSTRIKITYIPASLPTSTNVGLVEPTNRSGHSHYTQSHAAVATTHQPYPMRPPVIPHPMGPLQTAPLNQNHPNLIPPSAQATNYSHWMQHQHMGYNPPPTGPSIPSRGPQVNLQTSYIEHPVPIKPPPPPYQLYQNALGHGGQPYGTHMNYIPGLEYQTPPGGGQWNMGGIQNPLQYGGGGNRDYIGGGGATGGTQYNQQMSAAAAPPPGHLMTHTPHQPYQPDSYHYNMQQYNKHDEVGGAVMRSGNGTYDMKQNRNVPDWQQGNQPMDSYSSSSSCKLGTNATISSNILEPLGPPRLVEVKRDGNGSLGISLGLPEGGIEGVVIINLTLACSNINKGKLLVGDRILEVNGHNLRHATQTEAVSIIKHSTGPVKMLVQSYSGANGGGPGGRKRFQYSPLHSTDGSWAIDEEEDEVLRQMFPSISGYLFEVTLNKGNGVLGLSIWKTRETQSVVVMQVQPGGLADQTAKIRRGDQILQVNDRCVIGWYHEDVSRLLKQSPPLVKLILVRPLPVSLNSVQSNLPTSVAGIQNLRQKLNILQKQQSQQQQQPEEDTAPVAEDHPVKPTVSRQTTEKDMDEDGSGNKMNSLVDMTGLPLVKAITIDRDDDIGLGFTVSEIESQGEPRVVVSSIVPKGPADKEGQLIVGDNIISIDGHKVIGAKYEKATHLLQQARSRGSVNLIVSSLTKLPAKLTEKIEPTPHKRKNMGEKRKRVRSEGVTLRNKITKKPQIRSKRRPVSVDCEMKYDMSGILRIDSQSSSKGDGSSSGSHSNRNSRILNEAEARQGMDGFIPPILDNDIKPGKLSTIEIFKGNEDLGISITGGVGSFQEGIFINKIEPGTPAAFDGRLKPGDRIIKVCHTPVDTATKGDVIRMLTEAQSVVQISVYRTPTTVDHPSTVTSNGSTGTISTMITMAAPSTTTNKDSNIETVEVIKPEQRGIGLMIVEDNSKGVIVNDVVEGEAASFTSKIYKGDKILAINGEDITTAGRDHAISLLQNCRGKVMLKVHHLGEEALSRTVSVDNTHDVDYLPSHYQCDYTKGTGRKLPPSYHSPSPPITTTGSGGAGGGLPSLHEHSMYNGQPPPPTSDTTPLRDSRGTTPLRSDHSFDDDTPSMIQQQYGRTTTKLPPSNRYRDVVGQNIPDSTHIPQGHEIGQLQRRNVRVVHLRRGPTGLGFSIVGGKDSPNGDLPICVRTVSRESVASKEGLLQPGDVIVAVNGISFENCSHQTAVDTLKRCGDGIMLTICSP